MTTGASDFQFEAKLNINLCKDSLFIRYRSFDDRNDNLTTLGPHCNRYFNPTATQNGKLTIVTCWTPEYGYIGKCI